jgi:putative endopeptidase
VVGGIAGLLQRRLEEGAGSRCALGQCRFSGVDAGAIDAAVRPQDDFFRYSQGKWLKDVEIPSDRSSWGAFNVAAGQGRDPDPHHDRAGRAGQERAPVRTRQKMGDFYASYVDEARRNELGLAPLKGNWRASRR